MRDEPVFTICPDSEFFGREPELSYIIKRAADSNRSLPGLFIYGGKWAGKTELLRRVHRKLFWEQGRVAPVYFEIKDFGATGFSEAYLKETVKQYMAFLKRDAGFARAEHPLHALEDALAEAGLEDISLSISRHREFTKKGYYAPALREALSLPGRICARSAVPVFMMIDGIDFATAAYAPGFVNELIQSLGKTFPFIVSSATRPIRCQAASPLEAIELRGLEAEPAASMLAELCRANALDADTDTLSFAAKKLSGNPMYMKMAVRSAAREKASFAGLKGFAGVYAKELTSGSIRFALVSALALEDLNDLKAMKLLSEGKALSADSLAQRLGIEPAEARISIERLISMGVAEKEMGALRWAGDGVIKDLVNIVYHERVRARSVEEARARLIKEVLKEGFRDSGAKISAALLEQTASMLAAFNCQKVLKNLFRDEKAKDKLAQPKDDTIELPQMIGCFSANSLEKDEEKTIPIIIASGFQNSRYESGNEVVWITGVKDSGSPANIGDAENFIRRSGLLRENFKDLRIGRWLVSAEGFTQEAQRRLESEGVFITDAHKLRILKGIVEERHGLETGAAPSSIRKEFEMILPMSTKAELVAVKAAEEIGMEMGFDDDSISQIKSALVEACINAFEHSKVKAGRVHLRFTAYSDRLVIHVQNRGEEFDNKQPGQRAAVTGLPQKRGWGLELMRGLMDEVRLEGIQGGARVVMVKYLIRNGAQKLDKER